MRRDIKAIPSSELFSAKAATGVTRAHRVNDYHHLTLIITTAASTSGTLKIRGAAQPSVDLTASNSVSNPWAMIGFYDIESGAFTEGDTGLTLAASTTYQLIVNVDILDQIALDLTAISAGAVTASAILSDNG